MQKPEPVVLERFPVRLEPLTQFHATELANAARDGELWKLHYTSVPEPGAELTYIEQALQGYRDGHMLPFVVRDLQTNTIVGTTRYHDIVPTVERLEIGYTWYSKRVQRSAVNTTCKWLLMRHAFEELGAQIVGLRTDILNLTSQRAIERLGAQKDGVLRHHTLRRDGTVRDTVMYSITRPEWPEVKQRLEGFLNVDRSKANN
ncbi:MAG: GNAT family protein [Pirellulaceae bacterium]